MAPKTKSGKAKTKQVYTAEQLLIAVGVATLAFLAFAYWPDFSETKGYDSWLAGRGVRRARLETKCTGTGADRQCGFVAKKNIERGEKVVTIPMSSVLNYQSVMKDPTFEEMLNLEGLKQAFTDNGLVAEYMMPSFAMTFKVWYERKLGSRSGLSGWFDVLPGEPNNAMFFTDEEANCLDKLAYEERNASLSTARAYAAVAGVACAGRSETPCTSYDADTAVLEFKHAYAILAQRSWGDMRNPTVLPVADLAFPHPDLCNPKGDGDERCANRDKQFALQPKQSDDETLVLQAITYLLKGEQVYTLSQARAPWETLAIYGYADYAATLIPDLLFISNFHKFAQEHRLATDSLLKDHPLRECGQRSQMAWQHSGTPKKELRDCYLAYYYFTENPHHLKWDDDALTAWTAFQKDKVAQAKFRYMTWRSMAQAAEGIAMYVLGSRSSLCDEQSGRLPVIKASIDVSRGMFSRIKSTCEKKTVDSLAKWQGLDEAADPNVPLPQPPQKEEVDDSANIAEDDSNVNIDDSE